MLCFQKLWQKELQRPPGMKQWNNIKLREKMKHLRDISFEGLFAPK